MKQKPKYVNFVGARLVQGQYRNMCLEDGDMLTGKGSIVSYYTAPVFDSRQEQESWQSLHLDLDTHACKVTVLAAASDEDYTAVFQNPEMSFEEKEELIRSFDCVEKINTQDILLTNLLGRYFYLLIKIQGQADGAFTFWGAKTEFPKNTFLEYFPEVYRQNNDFFERYISIFQTLYLNLEKEVDALPDRLDYEKAQGEDLIALAEWAGLHKIWIDEAMQNGGEEGIRRLIASANELQSAKGTCNVLELLMKLLYGRDTDVLEYYKWFEDIEKNPKLLTTYRRLYGKEDTVSIFLDEEQGKLPDREQTDRMQKAAAQVLPIGTKLRMIPIRKNSHLDTHCYLGKNSRLASPAGMQTDQARLYGNLVLR